MDQTADTLTTAVRPHQSFVEGLSGVSYEAIGHAFTLTFYSLQ